eukprot:3347788-Pleurochrysis_carterae.AAC.3
MVKGHPAQTSAAQERLGSAFHIVLTQRNNALTALNTAAERAHKRAQNIHLKDLAQREETVQALGQLRAENDQVNCSKAHPPFSRHIPGASRELCTNACCNTIVAKSFPSKPRCGAAPADARCLGAHGEGAAQALGRDGGLAVRAVHDGG